MSDTTHEPILHAPMESLGYHVLLCAAGGAILGLLIAFGFVVKSHLDANAVSEVFRTARASLLVYRVEKGAWPENFNFSKPPVDLATRGFTPVRTALAKAQLEGEWLFEKKGPDGKPAVLFRLGRKDQDDERVLRIVDSRLDDGRVGTGIMRLKDGVASLTLGDE